MKPEPEEIKKEPSPGKLLNVIFYQIINSLNAVLDTVDIIRGAMVVKETAEGVKFIVKTAMGQDYVLSSSQVEARKAANNGRMV